MWLSPWSLSSLRRSNKQQSRDAQVRFRPTLEGLEERVVPSAAQMAAPALGPALASVLPGQSTAQTATVPVSITGVGVQNGQLVASGLVGNLPFTSPLTLTAQTPANSATPILDLQLAPIHLDLLGLKVDTSAICLDITAQPGTLLGSITNSLAGGQSLSSILGNLSATDTSTLTSGLQGLLGGALSALTAPSSVGTPTPATHRTTDILHLSLGPVNLNLLGLNVSLDNCNNGPVTLDISAQSGPGNLLGNLLNGVAHALDHNSSTNVVDTLLTQLADDILTLV